jgi:Holliday junction resolvase RusA-like endonuclease
MYTIKIDPIAKGRPRFARNGHAYTPEKTRICEEELKVLLRRKKLPIIPKGKAISLILVFRIKKPKSNKTEYHTQKPDSDNLEKMFMDAANGILWHDDCQVVQKYTYKGWSSTAGYINFNVEALN